VLLLDQALLDRLDLESLRSLSADGAGARVLLLGDACGDDLVVEVLRHRFHGFLLATCPPELALKAIRAVHRGEFWLSRAALARVIVRLLPAPCAADTAPPGQHTGSDGRRTLTRRERQIVDLLRRGCSNKEMARELGVMEDTVKKHLQGVFGKLGVHRRALVALHPPAAATASP
jgi:DNA-binding NarL/FixJ family response regulator